MKSVVLLAILSLFCLVRSENVLSLSKDNFDSTLKSNEVIMVEFFAPWCGHCKNLAPKYEAAATQLKGVANIAKVDCTLEADICSKYGIKGYPTLKVFRNSKPSDYEGPRESDAIVSFMKKQLLPSLSILTADKVEEFSSSDKVVVIGFFESQDSEEFKLFQTIANGNRDDYTFGATTEASALSANSIDKKGIVLFKKFDEGKNVYDGDFEEEEIIDFIKMNSVPTMDDIGPQNYQSYMESGLPLAYLFVTGEGDRSTVGKEVEAVAKSLKGKMNFVYIDANQYGGHANNLNLKVGEWPSFSIQHPTKNTKYPFSGKITTDSIKAHCEGVLDGSIEPSMKSQPIPETQGPVYVVVGKNYNDLMSQGKDVLIEFYAPWCGHCKKLVPIYDELGEAYKNSGSVIIAKMDATENDLPADVPFQVQGFPTIKFIKKTGEVLDYNGDRSLEDFKKFIEENKSAASSSQSTEGDDNKQAERDEL